jgi:hypothetical protein
MSSLIIDRVGARLSNVRWEHRFKQSGSADSHVRAKSDPLGGESHAAQLDNKLFPFYPRLNLKLCRVPVGIYELDTAALAELSHSSRARRSRSRISAFSGLNAGPSTV